MEQEGSVMPIELKPCPFCGVVPDGVERYNLSGNTYFFVMCVNSDCKVCPDVDCCESPEEAADAWNTRAE